MEEKGGGIINWLAKLIEIQIDLIATTFISIINSLLNSLPNPNPNPNPKPDTGVEPSSSSAAASDHLLRRLGYGLLAAVHVAMVMTMVMAVAVIMGIMLVNYWVEEPVYVREKLMFDYTDVNPEAVFVFGRKVMETEVPIGHTFHVSVVLLLPDSDYNQHLGVFQLVAEVVSSSGKVIERSSQPWMLQYRSHPVRLMHTFLMGVPLLLGITHETQKVTIEMLNYKEDSLSRTEAIKVILMPRAGTSCLPQIYEAEIVMHSKLPRLKELVYNWKWTFYVWTSMYIYIMLLILVLCFFKPLLLLPTRSAGKEPLVVEREEKPEVRMPEEKEFTETLRKWQQYRRKRKAALLSSGFTETVGSTPVSSYTITKEDIAPSMEEDVGDSESVCFGG